MHISLRSPRRNNIVGNGIPLLHEATHWTYAIDDARRRKTWMSRFYNRSKDKDYLSPHAKLDLRKDKFPWTIATPQDDPLTRQIEGVTLEVYGTSELADQFAEEYREIPQQLRTFDRVRIEPDLSGPAYFFGVQDAEGQATGEDVAITTEWAHIIHLVPGHVIKKLELIENSEILREKLSLLAHWGYLGPELTKTVLDKNWRRGWIKRIHDCRGMNYN